MKAKFMHNERTRQLYETRLLTNFKDCSTMMWNMKDNLQSGIADFCDYLQEYIIHFRLFTSVYNSRLSIYKYI